MNTFLVWLKIAALIVICFLASTVMFGLFLFIPLIVWFWWAVDEPKPVPIPEPIDADDLNAEFWALLDREKQGDV